MNEKLQQYLQKLEAEDNFSGVVRITQGSEERFAAAYGYASRAWKVRNTLATRFDTASMTKLFTAVSTLQLIDQNLLTFDTPVVDFLGLHDTAISPAVNVYHLLTHTSGIGDDADEENGEVYADLDRFLRDVRAGKLLSPEQTTAFLSPQVPYRERDDWTMWYGFGLWFYVDKADRVVCYQKEGINAGVSGIIRYFPAQDVSVVLLSNIEEGVWEPIWEIHEMVMAGWLGDGLPSRQNG